MFLVVCVLLSSRYSHRVGTSIAVNSLGLRQIRSVE